MDKESNRRELRRDTVYLIGHLLPVFDFFAVLLAAALGTLIYASCVSPGTVDSRFLANGFRAALAAAVLAPLILCDSAFVSFASAAFIRCYVVRFLISVSVVAAIRLASRSLTPLPNVWLMLWIASSLLLTAITRLLLLAILRRLEAKGILAETVAVVGAGAVADRLIAHLVQTRGHSLKLLGVFDDQIGRSDDCTHMPTGSISDLIELGKSRSMDWILITLPGSDEELLQSIVHRLKALPVPVGLCPQDVGLTEPRQTITNFGDDSRMTLFTSDARQRRRDSAITTIETILPRWIITLGTLLFAVLRGLTAASRALDSPCTAVVRPKLICPFDDYDLGGFTDVAARFGQQRFGYVVTPNADHLIRLHRDPLFRESYANAAYILLDSRFISALVHFTQKRQLPVCTGSDLVATLFSKVIAGGDSLVLIGGSNKQAARLAERYGLERLAHFNPPMGFIRDPKALETTLQFIEAHSPFRYCLLAVGAPQQEQLAQHLKARGIARGMALCIGASINFLTGDQRRAPLWMQRRGMEWLFRLLQAPERMANRYLVRGPQLFGLLRRTEIILRPRPSSSPADLRHPRRTALKKRFLARRALLVRRHRQRGLADRKPEETQEPPTSIECHTFLYKEDGSAARDQLSLSE